MRRPYRYPSPRHWHENRVTRQSGRQGLRWLGQSGGLPSTTMNSCDEQPIFSMTIHLRRLLGIRLYSALSPATMVL